MEASAGLTVLGVTLFQGGVVSLGTVHWKAVALAAVLLVLTRWVKPTKKLHPIVFILASGVIGALLKF